MKVMSTILVALVLAALGASRAQGTEEWSFEAFQPIWTDNDISLSRVTVLTFNSGEVGVYAVLATCDSNRVMTDYGPQQRNAAFEVGLRAEVTFNSNREPPLLLNLYFSPLEPKNEHKNCTDFLFVFDLTQRAARGDSYLHQRGCCRCSCPR